MTTDKARLFQHYWDVIGYKAIPEAEYKFLETRKFRFDWAFPAQRVAVEVDGGVWLPRGGRHGTDKDREKMNLAAADGWLVFHFSPQMLDADPVGCCRLVAKVLDVS
jgi:very-short-patch-repair endonuclease